MPSRLAARRRMPHASSSALAIVSLVIYSVDSALEIVVRTQVPEGFNDSILFVFPALFAHPVEVEMVVEVDVTLERDVKVTDVFALVDVDALSFKLCACGLYPVLHTLTEEGDSYCLGDDGHGGLLGLFDGVDL